MKEKDKKKTLMIVGIITFALYIILYLLNVGINALFYKTPIMPLLLRIIRILLTNGLILAYMIIMATKKKQSKSDIIFHCILLVVLLFLVAVNIKDVSSQLLLLFRYGGNTIRMGINVLEILLAMILYLLIGINVLGLTIQKKFPYKIITYIILVGIVLALLLSCVQGVINLVMIRNVRFLLLLIVNILTAIPYSIYQASYVYLIYTKSKEIQ